MITHPRVPYPGWPESCQDCWPSGLSRPVSDPAAPHPGDPTPQPEWIRRRNAGTLAAKDMTGARR